MFSGPPSMGRPFVMASLLARRKVEIRRDPQRPDLYASRPKKTPERQREDLHALIYDYAPRTLLGRFLPDDGSAAAFIHNCYSREAWHCNWTRMVINLVVASLVWPLATVATMLWFTSRNGCTIRKRTGKGLAKQLCEQFYLAMAYSIRPRWYYIFELHDDALRRKAGEYLLRFETKRGVYRMLKEGRASLSSLSDKAAFASKCATCRIPAVPVILSADRGIVAWNISNATLPPIDLFIKPSSSKGGRGAERWDYESPKGYRNVTGASLTEQELLQHLMTLSREREREYILQPRVVNHPLLADLSNGALSTLRIMTCRNEHGEVEVTNAVFRMARGRNAVVDNFHAGGIAAAVDVATGQLWRATDMGVDAATGWCDVHPQTGGVISGRKLPLWRETIQLVEQAHAIFSDRILIGWDVAILEDGPHLVEGNGAPDLDIVQRTHRAPIGNDRVGQILAFHLKQVVAPGKALFIAI